MGQFKNVLSVVEVNGAFAVAIDKVPTGQVYKTRELASAEVAKIRAKRKENKTAKK
jgi:hypothetical protein